MTETKISKLIRNWPVLRLYVEIPYFSIRTHLMNYRYTDIAYEYVFIEIRLHKWQTSFELYKARIWQ